MKMSRQMRAKQFSPFDALKGLQDALRLKEYQHERIVKGDLSEEKAIELSKTLLNLEKNDIVQVTYFENGHYLKVQGKVVLNVEDNTLSVDRKRLSLDDIFEIFKI